MDSECACDALPYDVAKVKAGEPCPNNPYIRYQQQTDKISDAYWILQKVGEWLEYIDMGNAISPDEISPAEWSMVMEAIRVRNNPPQDEEPKLPWSAKS